MGATNIECNYAVRRLLGSVVDRCNSCQISLVRRVTHASPKDKDHIRSEGSLHCRLVDTRAVSIPDVAEGVRRGHGRRDGGRGMNFWEECISEAFDDAGITATDEQIATVASWVEGTHENYGLATGSECIPNPLESTVGELKRQIRALERDVEYSNDSFRQNVAWRHNCSVHDVTLEDYGRAWVRM